MVAVLTNMTAQPGLTVTIETKTDDPCERVIITFSGAGPLATYQVTRTVEDFTWVVPGASAFSFADSYVLTDYTAPLGRPIVYTIYKNGSVLTTWTTTLNSPNSRLQDPIRPDQSLPVMHSGRWPGKLTLTSETGGSINRPAAGTAIPVIGDPFPRQYVGTRQAPGKIKLGLKVYDEPTSTLVRGIAASAPILLFRPLPSVIGLPPLVYLLGDVTEEPVIRWGSTYTLWHMTGDLVAAVVQAAITGQITYAQVQALLGNYTYDQILSAAASTTYLDWQKNPMIFTTF